MVLETGIGGLLDSTNVIPPPLVSVITSISLDHTAILGDTIEKIAEQKAGIIKNGSTAVLSMDNNKNVADIIRRTALEKKCELIIPDYRDFKYQAMEITGNPFIYKGERFKTAMLGFHQPCNAVTAIEVCRCLRKKYFWVTEEAIRRSIETVKVKGRIQYIPENPPVIVDGGHNPAGITSLSRVLDNLKLQGKKIITVMGMVDSKDYKSGVEKISALSEKIFLVDDFADNAVPAEKLAEIASEYTSAEPCSSLKTAVSMAKKLALECNGIAVISGSLYLASDYLNQFGDSSE